MSARLRRTDFTFIDLFAGIGGNRLAFERAGGKCVFASEIDESSRNIYFENFNETPAEDIEEIDERDIPDHDVLLACLPLGTSSSKQTQYSHARDEWNLFHKVAHILDVRRPRAFFFESMPGLKTLGLYQNVKAVLESELGYHVCEQVLDASCVVPQRRRRLYIVGFKEKTPFQFPRFVGSAPKLGNILETEVDPKYTLSDQRWTRVKEHICDRGEGKNLRKAAPRIKVASPNDVLHRPFDSNTVREVFINQGEGRNPRRFTPRECSRLMGFPDSFKIPVSDTQAYSRFPRSVVVPMVEKIADEIVECLFGKIEIKGQTEKTGEPEQPWKALQNRVALWLRRTYGFEVKTPDLVTGDVTERPYDVDVHAWKLKGSLVKRRVDVWVECKKLKTNIKRRQVSALLQKAKEVRDGVKWKPNILMFVADGHFDFDAIRIANKYGIYLVKVDAGGFQFIGKMSRDDFNNLKFSEY